MQNGLFNGLKYVKPCTLFVTNMGYCLLAFIVLCTINPASTLTNGGTLYCQEEWKAGEKVTLSFHVDTTIFLQTCKNSPNPTYFKKSNNAGAAPDINCTVYNIKSSENCSSASFPPGTLGCGCTGKNNSHYMLEYNFIASSDYNGWWSADIVCRDGSFNQLLSFSKVNCDDKKESTRLYPCDASGYRDVEENTAVTFHCDQYSRDVKWSYMGPRSASFDTITACDATRCTRSAAVVFTPTYISAGNSSLTSTLTSRSLGQAGGEYECGSKKCKLHIIVPASVSKPTSFITRTDQGFSLDCQTRITKVFSSKGQYSCMWQIGQMKVNGTLNLQPPPDNTTNTSDRMGTCNVTLQLSNPSDAICHVSVSPGNTFASSSIVRPSQPDINCTKCKVPENRNITCTCSTDNLGQPGGRLVWYAGTNGVFDREIVRGNFEINKLNMTWPLNRSDHNVTMFRCVNEWLENVNSLTDFTAILTWDENSISKRRRRKRSADSTSSPCFDTPKEDHSIGIIAGSIAAGGTVLISVVVIIVYVIKRRKKGVQKSTCNHPQNGDPTSREEDPDYDNEIINPYYVSSGPTIGQVPGSNYEDIDGMRVNPTLQFAAYAQSSNYAEKENISDEYACVRRDR